MTLNDEKFNSMMKNMTRQDDENLNNIHEEAKESKKIIKELNDATENNFKDFDELLASPLAEEKNILSTLTILLNKTNNTETKEWIVRALTTAKARKVSLKALIEEFKKTKSDKLRWVIGNAIGSMVDESDSVQLIELAINRKYGSSRQMIVYALRKSENPKIVNTLLQLLKDEEVVGHAIEALIRLKPKRAKPYLIPFLNNSNSWIRNSAKKAVDNIDKSGTEL